MSIILILSNNFGDNMHIIEKTVIFLLIMDMMEF